jgi:hypothetical protein
MSFCVRKYGAKHLEKVIHLRLIGVLMPVSCFRAELSSVAYFKYTATQAVSIDRLSEVGGHPREYATYRTRYDSFHPFPVFI